MGGVMLAMASLGRLLGSVLPQLAHVKPLFGTIAAILLVLLVSKFALFPRDVLNELKRPTIAGVFGTFFMGLLMLNSYLEPWLQPLVTIIWAVTFALFGVLFVYFAILIIRRHDVDDISPAYFITLVGPTVGCIFGIDYGFRWFCEPLFYFESVIMVVLVVVVSARCLLRPIRREATRPLFCIYAAPISMCLDCYLVLYPNADTVLAGAIYAVGIVFYLIAFANLLRCLPLNFYPSYAAMTFPFVISATCTGRVAMLFGNPFWLQIILAVQVGIAVTIGVYVLVYYLGFLSLPLRHRRELRE